MANSTAITRAHLRVSASQARSPVLSHRCSVISSSHGSPTPNTAKTMWKARENPVSIRASVSGLPGMVRLPVVSFYDQ